MYKLIKPLLFQFDPETIHYVVTGALQRANRIWGVKSLLKNLYQLEDKRLAREVLGLKFKNPLGLAAGFDKNASMIEELAEF